MDFLKRNPNPPYADQDTLNAIFGQKYHNLIEFLPPEYNLFSDIDYNDNYDKLPYEAKFLRYALAKPKIYHFAGAYKPWATLNIKNFYEKWWYYYKLSPINKHHIIKQLLLFFKPEINRKNLFSFRWSNKRHYIKFFNNVLYSDEPKDYFVSIIVTSYNYENFIRQTLDSILAQTYQNYEVIIVDDGSKDNSINIIKEFTDKYSNFKLYTHENSENKGLAESLKLGISKAGGEYTAFLESDDFWDKDYLQEKINFINSNKNNSIVINDIQTLGETRCDAYVNYQSYFFKRKSKKKNLFKYFYNDNAIPTFSEVMIKSSILKSLDFNTPVSSWLDFWLWRQVALIYPIGYVDKKLTFWRIHNKSFVMQNFEENNKNKKIFKKASNKLLIKKFFTKFLYTKLLIGLEKKYKKLIHRPKHPKNNLLKKNEYINHIFKQNFEKKSSDYVEIAEDNITISNNILKIIAFYLPQFHTFPENEKWHGRGFTEWTNVTKTIPQYTGHHQPQLPVDVGFYDLSTDKVMYRQIELAKKYGISGFCFHYYWFSGKRLMERPIFNYLNNKDLDFPFCLCWANENWSKRWDGGNTDLLMEQKLQDGDDEKFFYDILPFFKDDRYIKINNKPVLIIYRPHLFTLERIEKFVKTIRKLAKENGYEDLYLINAKSFGYCWKPEKYFMDAMVEFPPLEIKHLLKEKDLNCYVNKYFAGNVYNMHDYINNKKFLYDADYKLFKTVFPGWDNTARRGYIQADVYDTTPLDYKHWLSECIKWTKQNN